MSREAINKILTRAMIDAQFGQRLLTDPLQTAISSGFDLTREEQDMFSGAKASSISELSEIILGQLDHEERA